MALSATIHHFQVTLSDVDRAVYEALDFRVARHPSESARYLTTRHVRSRTACRTRRGSPSAKRACPLPRSRRSACATRRAFCLPGSTWGSPPPSGFTRPPRRRGEWRSTRTSTRSCSDERCRADPSTRRVRSKCGGWPRRFSTRSSGVSAARRSSRSFARTADSTLRSTTTSSKERSSACDAVPRCFDMRPIERIETFHFFPLGDALFALRSRSSSSRLRSIPHRYPERPPSLRTTR
jgi:YaeQ protein